MKYAIVLAAGKGTRMKSGTTKVMHPILHKPMIGHIIDHLHEAEVDKIVVVAGYQREKIEAYLGDKVEYAFQDEQMGTKDAVTKVTQLRGKIGDTLLIFGDCALIQTETFHNIYKAHEGYDLTLVSAKMDNPGKYSRIVRDNQGSVENVVDYRNLSETEKSMNEIDLGVYCFNNELLYKYIADFDEDDPNVEINISALVAVMRRNNHKIRVLRVDNTDEFMGINDRFQLAKANTWLRSKINNEFLEKGVAIIDPDNTYIGPDTRIEEDVTIYPNTHIYGASAIGHRTLILPNSWLENASIGDDCTIDSSKIIDSQLMNQVKLGPYAHLRANTVVGTGSRVGNFVEFKNTRFGAGSSSAHLTYLGDAIVGEKANIGCGVITCNYDGTHKHVTTIGDGVFVGSNVNLIAPLTLGDNAVVAAGSTISADVSAGDMVIERSAAITKPGYGIQYKNKGEEK